MSILNQQVSKDKLMPVQLSLSQLEALLQIFKRTTWDGDLIGKRQKNDLVELGFVEKSHGFNFITRAGIEYLHENNMIGYYGQGVYLKRDIEEK